MKTQDKDQIIRNLHKIVESWKRSYYEAFDEAEPYKKAFGSFMNFYLKTRTSLYKLHKKDPKNKKLKKLFKKVDGFVKEWKM